MKFCLGIVWSVSLISVAGFAGKASAAPAFPCSLEWQPSADASVAGYALYYGVAGLPITNRLDIGAATTVTVKNLIASSTYSFYVVAYDTSQVESTPSNVLLYTAQAISSLELSCPANGPANVSFLVAPGAACHVEYSDSLSPPQWNVLTNAIADANGRVTVNDATVSSRQSRFYRAATP